MNKRIVTAIAAALPMMAMAQTAVDAFQLSRYDLRGTARFMSMGGAFGALGGDLSTLNQNPGGIGVYRKSEIGITLDIDMQSTNTTSAQGSFKDSQTKAYVTNLGYVGSAFTGSDVMPVFNWGFSYGRTASFDRRYHGTLDMNSSLSNYIAGYTTKEGWDSNSMTGDDASYFNGYYAPWLSTLSYISYIINPISGTTNQYEGLWKDGSTYGVSDFDVEEKGYVDEYEINLGGNFSDMVYWGIGVGITDLDYQRRVYYSEYTDMAQLPVLENGQVVAGPPAQINDNGNVKDSGFDLGSWKQISGTGFNFKAGVIVKPINELRLGFAIHTPTYYNLSENSYGDMTSYYGYSYRNGLYDGPQIVSHGTPVNYSDWKFRSPWRMIFSAATVIGAKAIVSLDYEYRPYQNMTVKSNGYNNYDSDFDAINSDIKNYYKSANIIRLGAEYRLTSNLSLRAGYAYESTPTGTEVSNDEMMVYTSNPFDTGTMPSYTLDNSTQYITAGIGYRYKNFYVDAAYVHKSMKTEFHPYTGHNGYTPDPETAEVKASNNNLVFSVGFKF